MGHKKTSIGRHIIKALALMASWRLDGIEIIDMVSRATALDC
jgi:hypothetical protein